MAVNKSPSPPASSLWRSQTRLGRLVLGLELSCSFMLSLLSNKDIITAYLKFSVYYLMCYLLGFCLVSASTLGLLVLLPFIFLGPIGGAVILTFALPGACLVCGLGFLGMLPVQLFELLGHGILLPFIPLSSICWFLTQIFVPMGAVKFLNIGLNVMLTTDDAHPPINSQAKKSDIRSIVNAAENANPKTFVFGILTRLLNSLKLLSIDVTTRLLLRFLLIFTGTQTLGTILSSATQSWLIR
ncbi:hypothetical protein TrLO_g6585 [Triparma laevis f. longispina]|uniref:Uncharacterized protein n=1 Tax=Triparma laevis f. longispina TaxID=1714387 RepID=A0A9W7KXI1_9STRA|nr:hypothetical protein TrLO_g6585 [Triparma laevis f. longispina]